jgi:DNA-binding ferritin-like protein (Dps family)
MLLKVNLKVEKKKAEKRGKNLQILNQKVQELINILISYLFKHMVLGRNYLILLQKILMLHEKLKLCLLVI